jgi:hypothetical protein
MRNAVCTETVVRASAWTWRIAMSHELTRDDFLDQLAAFERRLVERLDLLERLIALGFDDATDQLRVRLGNPESATANAGLSNGRN